MTMKRNTELWSLMKELEEDIQHPMGEQQAPRDSARPTKDKCLHCKQPDFLQSDGEMIVCTFCGCENSFIVDTQAEWRNYGEEGKRGGDPTRCGAMGDTSLSIVILGRGFEVYRKLNSWNGLSYKERSFIGILNKIANKANIDNVPQSVIDATIHLYKIISEDYIKRGECRESLIAACFFNALRDQGILRNVDEIAHLFDIDVKKLSKGCNEFAELMYSKNKKYVPNSKPLEAKDLIRQYCLNLNIDETHRDHALKTAFLVDKLGICQENNPKSISVGVIYLISQTYKLSLTKKDIAVACKTSEVTVTNTYNQMIRFKKYILET